MDIFKQRLTYREAYAKATDLCGRSEKCGFDLEMKCREWQLSGEESAKLISSLVKDNFIDQRRYATSFVNDKFRFNKWGKIKLAYALRQKQVEDKYIREALSNLPEDAYLKVLLDLLSAKAKTIKETDGFTLRGKLLAFAQSRGFEVDLTLKIIEGM
jgi:regulatory protein